MPRVFVLVLSFCIPFLMLALTAQADGQPSKGAQGMPGARGTFEFKPEDWIKGTLTWWKDTDGIKPGEAGCHVGTDRNGKPNGRAFGEACLSGVLLVESNPGTDELRSHKDDIGHPDRFDCNAWCVGQAHQKGFVNPYRRLLLVSSQPNVSATE